MDNQHFQREIEGVIDELIFKGYTLPELQKPLININWWWNESPYDKAVIDCDGMKGTFKNLLRAVELFTGDYTAFNLDLMEWVGQAIESRWDIKMGLEQEDYMANYKPELRVTA